MVMTDSLSLEQRQTQAAQTVRRFVRRFNPAYRALACHAALPLVLTPELVNYLRNEFLRDQEVPWVAEVDLLLSDLCQPVGYELYALDTDVRAYLLAELERQHGQDRLRRVAKLLISYVRYLDETNPAANKKELEAQQWAAMVYLDEGQRRKAVEQIVAKLGATKVERLGESLVGQAELARLAEIATELAPQLVDYPALVDYAALVREVMAGASVIAPDRLAQTYEVLPGQTLQLPEPLVREARGRQAPGVTVEGSEPLSTDAIQEAAWPELKTLTFETGQWVEESDEATAIDWPILEPQTVRVAELYFEDEAEPEAEPDSPNQETEAELTLTSFSFEVATITRDKSSGEWQITRERGEADLYEELLGNGVTLEMVAIPGGSFVMGASEDEPDRLGRQEKQHLVQVPGFLMGRYPVTQTQWQFVVSLSQVQRGLNADPSRFKGADRPVERVSWFDAVEFCARLSAYTGREYRLPSEAEWEYACRANTTTPFHFGETLSPELANYSSSKTYNDGPVGARIGATCPVGQFGIANAFGLSDMHGNVAEWCLDHYHDNYVGAPTDGSAWIDGAKSGKSRVRRGGSWNNYPWACRSAYRDRRLNPRGYYDNIGFRVVCVTPRALT